MNKTLILAFWKERFTSLVRLALLITTWGFPILLTLFQEPIRVPLASGFFGAFMVLGAGVIGRDLSSGVLQLILARPVTRQEYVLSRWAALGSACFGVGFVGWLIVLPLSISSGGMPVDEALLRLVDIAVTAYGFAAVLTGLSALLPGFGDLAILLGGTIAAGTISFLGATLNHPEIRRIGIEISATLFPAFESGRLFHDGTFHYYPLVSWASTLFLGLLLAVYAMNHREFSYGSAG
ncbi:MAG: hypothetical protein FD129_2853 [bacterium]|nr:MAG: hypothetical protein FD129_2853 [bacterium]